MHRSFVLAALAILTLAVPASAKPVARTAPHAVDWTRTVTATPSGSYVMGNPKARVKLIEYGSMSCPHCRAFDSEGVPTLIGKYVKSGQVSWEFRNYIRDPADLTAALIARCNGSKSFFALTRALFKDQPDWFGKAIAAPKDKLQQLAALPPREQFVSMAKVTGLDSWASAHGVPPAKSSQCLASVTGIERVLELTGNATAQFPDFEGTPTFVINGQMVKGVATWDGLEPQLKAALGG